eukprot:CAMPEP_0119556134 /NCGR_PEP_ID=MMETSP1352-20130426/8174_1 /TAXON_ID=265584 /ORGANISM="Stauroneis constricta, Strain CCMP1120" /LENGTH=179 /DNA_ID=CAMNT_0007603037 /DNA_START=361 /DNA_END=900 /DNA_ORIENTATION=-
MASRTGPLDTQYPVCSSWDIVLKNDDKVRGEIYTVDPISNFIFVKDQLSEVRMINAAFIKSSTLIKKAEQSDIQALSALAKATHSKRALEEKEKRAIRLAEESFRNNNPKASAFGQAVFDRLVKACNEVSWDGNSIIVMSQIRVDPPYGQDNCKPIKTGKGASGLDRIQKIVASTPTVS